MPGGRLLQLKTEIKNTFYPCSLLGPVWSIRLCVGGISLCQARWSWKPSDREVRGVTHYPLPGEPPVFNVGRAAKSDYPSKSSFQYIFLPWIMYQSTFHTWLPRICGCAVFAVFTAESRMLKPELEVGVNSQSQKWCSEALGRGSVLTCVGVLLVSDPQMC